MPLEIFDDGFLHHEVAGEAINLSHNDQLYAVIYQRSDQTPAARDGHLGRTRQ